MSRKGDILHVLATKSSNKQLVHRNALAVFADLKVLLRETATGLNSQICAIDHSVVIEFVDRGEYEVEIRFSGDSLIFQVHSNAFALPEKHPLRQTPYVQADEKRAFFGLIHVYNFLSDSFKMRRMNDAGMLLSRFFGGRARSFRNALYGNSHHPRSHANLGGARHAPSDGYGSGGRALQ